MENQLNISASPHVRDASTVRRTMLDVIIALVPASAFGVYRFGIHALIVIISCVAFSVLVEGLYQKFTGRDVTISDCSAALTGLLVALNMPPAIPIFIPMLGCLFAILMVKQIFGGLGQNFMNPALAARCFLHISFAKQMTDFAVDGISSATPIIMLKEGMTVNGSFVLDAFLGNIGGVIGETSAAALLIGAIYLMIRKVISPRIPLTYIFTFAVFAALFGGHLTSPDLGMYVMAQIFSGGLMLGAWFMATDYVTSPITPKGRIIYGVILGLLTGVFRMFGSAARGVSYAIILGNMMTPLIERTSMPKAFGVVYKKEKMEKSGDVQAQVQNHKTEPRIKLNALIVLTCITLAAGAALGYIYQQTKDVIAQRKIDDTNRAYAKIFDGATEFNEIEGNFDDIVSSSGEDYGNVVVGGVYDALNGEGTVGTVVNITSKDGYGGDIQIAVGIDADEKVTGVAILSINETAGLGMNAERDLVPQYPGKNGRLRVKKDGGDIEAISGATVTSRAVTNAVSAALYIAEVK